MLGHYCDSLRLLTELLVPYQRLVSQINTRDNCNLPTEVVFVQPYADTSSPPPRLAADAPATAFSQVLRHKSFSGLKVLAKDCKTFGKKKKSSNQFFIEIPNKLRLEAVNMGNTDHASFSSCFKVVKHHM